MKLKLVSLVAVALLVAASPAILAMVSAVGAALTSQRPDTVPCTFEHPESLPDEAADMASTALDARSTHCPPTLP